MVGIASFIDDINAKLDELDRLVAKHIEFTATTPYAMSATTSGGGAVFMSDYIAKPEKTLVPRTCPNCGAPVHGSQCDYCGSVFGDYEEEQDDGPRKTVGEYNSVKYGDERTVRKYNPATQMWEWVAG